MVCFTEKAFTMSCFTERERERDCVIKKTLSTIITMKKGSEPSALHPTSEFKTLNPKPYIQNHKP